MKTTGNPQEIRDGCGFETFILRVLCFGPFTECDLMCEVTVVGHGCWKIDHSGFLPYPACGGASSPSSLYLKTFVMKYVPFKFGICYHRFLLSLHLPSNYYQYLSMSIFFTAIKVKFMNKLYVKSLENTNTFVHNYFTNRINHIYV